jgi:hypothetical protein
MSTTAPDYFGNTVDQVQAAGDQLVGTVKQSYATAQNAFRSTVKTAKPDIQGAVDTGFDFVERVIGRQRAFVNSILARV